MNLHYKLQNCNVTDFVLFVSKLILKGLFPTLDNYLVIDQRSVTVFNFNMKRI